MAPPDIPDANAAWVADVRRRHHAIRSLFSDDFSDLRFLKPLLAGKRVVQLGESGHGVAEFNWLKVRLIKFLHQEMGYDVIAFESSLSGCALTDYRIGNATPRQVMRDCIFQVWHSSETLGLFEYLDAARKAGKRIALTGFDVQNSGGAQTQVKQRLVDLSKAYDADLALAIARHEERLARTVLDEEAASMVKDYEALARHLQDDGERATRFTKVPPADVALAIQECLGRMRYVKMNAYGIDRRAGFAMRDEGMADNLDFVLDRQYPGRKVVVWAHNAHIAKRENDVDAPRAMGAWVDRRRGSEVYTIGFYMGRGVAGQNDRRRYAIAPPPANSMEAVLANAGPRMSFVDMSRADAPADSWMAQPIVARSWGVNLVKIVPNRTYDAVIYIDTVTPPDYL